MGYPHPKKIQKWHLTVLPRATQTALGALYPAVTHDFYHIIKTLSYFTDAEADPMPKVFFDVTWRQVKMFFRKEAVAAARHFLGV